MSASGKRNSLSSLFEDELDYERSGYQAPPSIDVVVNNFFQIHLIIAQSTRFIQALKIGGLSSTNIC